MTKERNNGNYPININGGKEMNTFQNHNRYMLEFRKAHTNVALVNEPRLNDSTLIGNLGPLQVNYNLDETGGSAELSGTYFRSGLIPMAEIGQYKLSQN